MKLIKQIENIKLITEHNNNCYILGSYKCKSDETDYNFLYEEKGIKFWGNKILIGKEEFSEIKILDNQFNKVFELEEGFNLRPNFIINENLLIPNRITNSYWKLTPDLKLTELYSLKNYHRIINGLVFNIVFEKDIVVYEFGVEEPQWQLDTSQYGTYKVRTDDGFDEFPNKIDRPLFADETTIYAPMKGGQLLALNATDGSLKWILEMEISCGYANLGDRIYANNGDELFEIDANLGVVLKTVAYKSLKELKGYFGFTGDHKVYDDYIILKDQHNGWVVMFDRQTLTLSHMAETGERLSSDAESFHWLDNKLYIYTYRTSTVHIFEPE
jgi:PQQ enzyme repeat